MKKKYLTELFIFLSLFTAGKSELSAFESEMEKTRLQYGEKYIVIGSINNLVGKGEVKVKPDILITEFELKTEGNTLDQASNENAKTMTEFKNYLLSIGVEPDSIETSRYTRSEGTSDKNDNEKTGKYKTLLEVRLSNLDTNKFYQVVDILEKEGINELKRSNDYSSYYYSYIIESPVTNENAAKQAVKDKYDRIENRLISLGVNNISIGNYRTTEAAPEKKKVFYVTHTFRVKMKASTDMGKVLKKGQSLKIKNPGTLSYDVSEATRKKATLEAYEKAMSELADKSKSLLKNRGYELGDLKYLNDGSPYWDYGMGDKIVMMQNSSFAIDEKMASGSGDIDIPFSTSQEFKITVTLTASYDILKLKK